MVGILLSYWGRPIFRGELLVLGRVNSISNFGDHLPPQPLAMQLVVISSASRVASAFLSDITG